jgi:hypothetical protein
MWKNRKLEGILLRRTVNSFPRFSLMFPYLTVSSVVGVNSGTESGITFAVRKADWISEARVVERKDEGHVDWRSSKRGDANVDAAKSRERGDFKMAIGFALDIVKRNGHGIETMDKYIYMDSLYYH